MTINWQPITDEQKTGDYVLVYANVAGVDVVHVAFWSNGDQWREQGFDSQDEVSGWWSYANNSVTQEKLDEYRTPTHWAPYNPPEQA